MEDIEYLKQELAKARKLNRQFSDLLEEKEREVKSKKNHNFLQLYKQELRELRALTSKDSNAMSILLIMAEKMNKQNALIISQKNLQKITGKSRPTIARAISVLKESKFIDVIKIGTANAYIINSNVFWQENASMKDKIAIFTATIIASGEEQDKKYFENWDGVKLKRVPIMMDETPISLDLEQGEDND